MCFCTMLIFMVWVCDVALVINKPLVPVHGGEVGLAVGADVGAGFALCLSAQPAISLHHLVIRS